MWKLTCATKISTSNQRMNKMFIRGNRIFDQKQRLTYFNLLVPVKLACVKLRYSNCGDSLRIVLWKTRLELFSFKMTRRYFNSQIFKTRKIVKIYVKYDNRKFPLSNMNDVFPRRMGRTFLSFTRFNSILGSYQTRRDEWFKSTETNVLPSRDRRREFLSLASCASYLGLFLLRLFPRGSA